MEMINAIGRRKTSVARVYLTEGTGKIIINKVGIEFPCFLALAFGSVAFHIPKVFVDALLATELGY